MTPIANNKSVVASGTAKGKSMDERVLPETGAATNVVLTMTGLGIDGDFNGDSKVDMADYVVWRKSNGTPQNYLLWRSHYGVGSGSGSGSNVAASVPEPASILLIVLPACFLAIRRRGRLS